MHGQKSVKVVYEDEAVIVVDKPAGIPVIPDFKKSLTTLTDLVNQYLIFRKEQCRAHPCHRLDKETSGLVVFSKGKKNQQIVMSQFMLHRVKKRYIALVHGKLEKERGTIRGYISSNFRAAHKNFKKNPKLAVTDYRVIKSGKDFSVVEAWPITGRTNQLRIHFKQLGHPILGERKYAFGKDFALKFNRLALHAADITFCHPVSGKKLELSSILPKDMHNFINSRLGALELGRKN